MVKFRFPYFSFSKKYVYLNNAIAYCQIIQFMKAAH